MIEIISIHIPKTAGRSFLEILKTVYGNSAVFHFDQKNYHDELTTSLKQYKSEVPDQTRVIHGHFPYSSVRDLITPGKTKVLTWFRNPVERVISNFSFFKKRIELSENDLELQKRKGETLLEYSYLENSRNRMSKFIDGLPLNDFFFIGITEKFDEDIRVLGNMLGWSSFSIPRINDNTEFKSHLHPVTEKEKKIIEDLNMNDMGLYIKAMELRNKRIG